MSEPSTSRSRRRLVRPWRLAAALAGVAAAAVLTVGAGVGAPSQSAPAAASYSAGVGAKVIGPVINGVRWQ